MEIALGLTGRRGHDRKKKIIERWMWTKLGSQANAEVEKSNFFDFGEKSVYGQSMDKKSQPSDLASKFAELQQQREATADQLRDLNAVKGTLKADERIEREAELQVTLTQLDEATYSLTIASDLCHCHSRYCPTTWRTANEQRSF